MAPKKISSANKAKKLVVAAPTKKHQPQSPKLTYFLFLHQEELRKRKTSFMSISHTKFQLTHELITKTVKNIHKCSRDDIQILNRETIFNKNLKRQIARMRHYNFMRMAAYEQKQYDKFQQQQQKALTELQQQQKILAERQKQPSETNGDTDPEKSV